MWKYLNKGISTPLAIAIILILAITVGGVAWWQYGEIEKEKAVLPEIEIPERVSEEEIEEFTEEEPEVFKTEQYAKELCEGKTVVYNKMTVKLIHAGSFSLPGAEELFISCHHGDEFYFYIIDAGGNILFEMDNILFEMDNIRSSRLFQIIDIDNDGVLEIVWGTSVMSRGYAHAYGGVPSYPLKHVEAQIGHAYGGAYIYSLKHGEFFGIQIGLEWTSKDSVSPDKEWLDESRGLVLIEIEPEFSENLEKPEFQIFKEYLLSEAYSEWHRIYGEYRKTPIVIFPSSGEELKIGTIYTVEIYQPLGFGPEISPQLYRGEKWLGNLAGTRSEELKFKWPVGKYTYLDDEGERKTAIASEGDDYFIGLHIPGGPNPVDLSGGPFKIISP